MRVKLLTEHLRSFLVLKEAAQARPSLHLSKCQTVGNLMPRFNSVNAEEVEIKDAKTV